MSELKCLYCNSINLTKISENLYKCNSCGKTQRIEILIDKPIEDFDKMEVIYE